MDFIQKLQDDILQELLCNSIDSVSKLMKQEANEEKYPISTQLFKFQEENKLDTDFMKENIDKLLSSNDIQPTNVPKYKISYDNFDLETLKSYTDNLTKPCIFELDTEVDGLNGIRNKLVNAPKKTVYDKESKSYYQSSEYDEKNQSIFHQNVVKTEILNYFPKLNEHLFNADGFISKKNEFTPMHNEIQLSLNIQVEGKKHWTLIDPINSDYVFPIKSTNFIINYSIFSNKEQFNKVITKIPRYEVILERNQVLFVPAWFFHGVSTIEDSVSLSMRYIMPYYSFQEFYLPQNMFNHVLALVSNLYISSELKNPLSTIIDPQYIFKLVGIHNVKKSLEIPFIKILEEFLVKYFNQ
jgi:hypothetical protein